MSDYTAKHINDMEAGFGGGFVKARAELGVTAFGMQVIQLPPDFADYPEHDHAESAQEEVFVALGGSGWMDIEGERVELDGDTLVRVGPQTRSARSTPGPQGLRMLAIGGAPGEAYEIVAELTELERRLDAQPREASVSRCRRSAAAAISRAQAWTSSSCTSSTGECM